LGASAPIVFVSSTCYDLTDLRAELGAWLQKDGFIVKLSDNLDSGFEVDPLLNKIETCLQNVRRSDIVLFIFDRFYGKPLGGKYGEKSATHVEFEEAVREKKGLFHFARRGTWIDFTQWRRKGDSFPLHWVDTEQHEQFFKFLSEVDDLHNKEERNDWVDVFEKSPDLRMVVAERLYRRYPALAGARALTRDRVVRLHIEAKTTSLSVGHPVPISFHVRNAGLNVAQEVTAFVAMGGKSCGNEKYKGVLEVGAETPDWQFNLESDGSGKTYEVVCRCANLWGDRFEVRAALHQEVPRKQYRLGRETFRVIEAAD